MRRVSKQEWENEHMHSPMTEGEALAVDVRQELDRKFLDVWQDSTDYYAMSRAGAKFIWDSAVRAALIAASEGAEIAPEEVHVLIAGRYVLCDLQENTFDDLALYHARESAAHTAASGGEVAAAALREQPEARGVVDGLPWELRQQAKHAGVVTGELLNKAADALDALTAAQQPEKRAPVQGYHGGTIPWRVHGLAWEGYHKQFRGQSAERIAERGGFGTCEMDKYLPNWRDMAHAIDHPTAPPSAPAGVERKYPDDGNGDDDAYNRGWNECLEAVAQQPAQAAPGEIFNGGTEPPASDFHAAGQPVGAGRGVLPDRQDKPATPAFYSSGYSRRWNDPPPLKRKAPTPPGDDAAGGES